MAGTIDPKALTALAAGLLAQVQQQQQQLQPQSTASTSCSSNPAVPRPATSSNPQDNSVPLPSILGKRRRVRVTSVKPSKATKITTWDRNIMCLPKSYPEGCGDNIIVPRKKRALFASHGLIGKIHLESDWSEDEVFAEVRSVFHEPMGGDVNFPFTFLVPTGGGLKSLTKPALSSSFKWTPKEVAGRADSTVYILAGKELKNEADLFGDEDGGIVSDGEEDVPPKKVSDIPAKTAEYVPAKRATDIPAKIHHVPCDKSTPIHSSVPTPSIVTSAHEAFISLLDDSSESDEDIELQAAIAASITENNRDDVPTESLATVLDEHFSLYYPVVLDPDQANRVTIRRNHIWKDAVRAMSRSSFDPSRCIRVTFVGEEAVDDGGPRREFFSLALQEMTADGTIFQGPQHSRFFIHNVQGLTSRKFFYAGMLVAVSLANGGPGLNCLSETVYSYLCHGLQGKFTPDLSLIPDLDIKESLEQIQNATSNSKLRDLLLMDKFAFVMECGFLKPAAAVATGDIPDIVRAVYLEYTVLRSSQEIGQFIEGLQTVGIATLMKRHPLVIKKLFVHDEVANVTAQYLSELLVPIFSPRGHNQREEEEAVVLNWRDYLQDIEGGVTPSKILSFITGAEKPPPMGFAQQPTIRFIEDKTKILPTASTCALSLYLPLALTEYQSFQQNMDMAILNTIGFGQV